MKKIIFTMLAVFCMGIASSAQCSEEHRFTKREIALYSVCGLGALASFGFWAPSAVYIIAKYGFWASIQSTHFQRLCIDVATMALVARCIRQKMLKIKANAQEEKELAQLNEEAAAQNTAS